MGGILKLVAVACSGRGVAAAAVAVSIELSLLLCVELLEIACFASFNRKATCL